MLRNMLLREPQNSITQAGFCFLQAARLQQPLDLNRRRRTANSRHLVVQLTPSVTKIFLGPTFQHEWSPQPRRARRPARADVQLQLRVGQRLLAARKLSNLDSSACLEDRIPVNEFGSLC